MSRFVNRTLTCIASVAVAVLALRLALGPFRLWGIHVAVNSPFVAESAFWLAILGLLLCANESVMTAKSQEIAVAVFPGFHLAIVLGIVALAFAHNLADPFLSDDYIVLRAPALSWSTFAASLHTPGGDGSFRPIGTIYFQLLNAFAGADPVKWHSVALAFHLLNSALVFAIAWKFWHDRTAAAIAALVFGLNGTRPEAVVWGASNRDLLACACVLSSILLASYLRSGSSRLRLAVSLLLVVIGVLCKESAYAMPLIAFCLVLAGAAPLREARVFLLGSCAVCAALVAWRWQIFHGPGGYIDHATGQPSILSFHAVTAAKAVFIRIWAVLLTPVNWDSPATWWGPVAIVASLTGILLLTLTNPAAVSRRTRLSLIAATCCAVLPAIHLAMIGQSALGSRVLYLPAAPFALLIGSLALAADKRVIVTAAIMIAGMAGILEHNLNAWHAAALEARSLCPGCYRAEPDCARHLRWSLLFSKWISRMCRRRAKQVTDATCTSRSDRSSGPRRVRKRHAGP